MNLPAGAKAILAARKAGRRPAHPVLVNCTGAWLEGEANPQVLVTSAAHDWRFMVGLEAVVFVGKAPQFVQETLRGLAPHVEDVILWDADRAKGCDLWAVWEGKGLEAFALPARVRRGLPALPQDFRQRFVRWHVVAWTRGENMAFAQWN